MEATATLKRDGYFIDAQQGQIKRPAVGIKHQAAREYARSPPTSV